MRGRVALACLLLSGVAFAAPSQETQQTIQAALTCLKASAQKLDDLNSDATTVAYGIVGACNSEINRSIESGGQGTSFDAMQTFRARTNTFYLKTATEIVLGERAARAQISKPANPLDLNPAPEPSSGQSATKSSIGEGELIRKFRADAERGNAVAQFELGRAYNIGSGVPLDGKQAATWFRRAAEQGNARAQSELGFMYSVGGAVPKDYREATRWFRRAAEQGNAEAQAYLAGNYFLGLGVPQDFIAAYMWLNLAVAQGYVGMAGKRDEIAGRLTPEQLAEAQRRAVEFRPKLSGAPAN